MAEHFICYNIQNGIIGIKHEGKHKRHFSFAIQAPNSAVQTRGHTFKLETTRYRLNIAQHLFFNRVVSTWNGLPQNIVNLESSLSFKKALRTVNFHSLITFDRHMQ